MKINRKNHIKMKQLISLALCAMALVLSLPAGAMADSMDPWRYDAPESRDRMFYFDSGAGILIPADFFQISVERDATGALVNTGFIHYGQSMELTLTEIRPYLYNRQDAEYLDSLYQSLKRSNPKAVYDAKDSDWFALSGYSGEYIYYYEAKLANRVIHMEKMFYPTRNRAVCDRYVEQITGSFTTAAGSVSYGPPAGPGGTGYGYPPSAPGFAPPPPPAAQGGTAPALKIPDSPKSPYGIALRENLVYGIPYTDSEKRDVVTNTYYSRKDANKNNQPWYTSTFIEDSATGYRLGFYYADGLLFFADAYIKGQRSSVTFYFWGTQLLCVHDMRNGDSQLRFAGSDTYRAVVREFGDVYAKGTRG